MVATAHNYKGGRHRPENAQVDGTRDRRGICQVCKRRKFGHTFKQHITVRPIKVGKAWPA